jgi:predicted membrane protein
VTFKKVALWTAYGLLFGLVAFTVWNSNRVTDRIETTECLTAELIILNQVSTFVVFGAQEEVNSEARDALAASYIEAFNDLADRCDLDVQLPLPDEIDPDTFPRTATTVDG